MSEHGAMVTERVIEIPWALMRLPQAGVVLDVGSCDATYLASIPQPTRVLHCLDPRDCAAEMPAGAVFYHQNLIGNDLPRAAYDAVLLLSVLEHIGLPCYDQQPFARGDRLALAEIRGLLKPGGLALVTVPAGQSKITGWYRQYSPADLASLFAGWQVEIDYWAFDGAQYVPITAEVVTQYDYRDRNAEGAGAGALACLAARP